MVNPVLIAEANPADLELTLCALGQCALPHPLKIVRDGEEALDYLFSRSQNTTSQQESPALILLELKLPKVDGLDVLKAIRTTPRYAFTPVFVLTRSELYADMHRARLLGVDHYLVKPMDPDKYAFDVCKLVLDSILGRGNL
jgi:CheY-like chemotaxis protein